VCLVTLQGNGKFEITQSKYRLTEEQKQEEGQKLFDFCAQCLKTFIETNLGEDAVKDGEKFPLGFTVSHPISFFFSLSFSDQPLSPAALGFRFWVHLILEKLTI